MIYLSRLYYNFPKIWYDTLVFMDKHKPGVSVIIPIFNPDLDFLTKSLTLMIEYEGKMIEEILLIQDKNDVNRISIKKLQNISKKIKLIIQPSRGPAAARNTGINNAKAEIIVFIDSDCIPTKNWVREIIQPIFSENAVGVGGKVRSIKDGSILGRYASFRELLGKPTTDKNGKITHIITANCAFLKVRLKEVGGFDQSLRYTAEDLDITYLLCKRGYQNKLFYAFKSIVEHKQRTNLFSFWKQQYGYGYCTIYHCLLRKRDPADLGIKLPTLSNTIIYLFKYLLDSIFIPRHTDTRYRFLDRFIYFPFLDFYRKTAILMGARKSFVENRVQVFI